jgi:hypothetical protein
MWEDAVVVYLKVISQHIYLEGLRITTKCFSEDSRSPNRGLNPNLPKAMHKY